MIPTLLRTACWSLVLVALPAPAVTLSQVEDFSSGPLTWVHGIEHPNMPLIRENSGPLGSSDSALEVVSSFGSGVGSRLLALNSSSDWTGDYSGQGITGLRLDLRNIGPADLFIRIAVQGAAGWAATPGQPLPTGGSWANFFYDLDPATLQPIGGGDPAAILGDVREIRILHNNTADFRGASVTGGFRADNITTVPEPSAALLGSLAALILVRRRRERTGDFLTGFPVDTPKPAP